MSVTTTIPSIKISTCSSSPCCSSPTTSSHSLRYKHYYNVFTIRNSQAEGPLRRPAAPPVREEPSGGGSPPQPLKPSPPSPHKPASSYVVVDDKNVVTLEFQRQKAKELQEYFKQKKLDEADQGPAFGFIGKNEINNGRWAMFGFAVGLLTEYATGSDFVDQVKILLSNFGILDLE